MGATGAIRQKIGLAFSKEGWARFFSHHDLMRFFERALRRAELPVRYTEGFNPRPRMVFLTPLGLGIASRTEHLEIEFVEPVGLDIVRQKIAPLMLPGMAVVNIEDLPCKRQGRKVDSISYRITGFPSAPAAQEMLARKVSELTSAESIPVERGGRRGHRTVDIAPSLTGMEFDGESVNFTIITREGATARADEIAGFLAEVISCDPLNLCIEKVDTVLTR